MRYFQQAAGGESRLLVDDGGDTHDLTSADGTLDSFVSLARTARAACESIDTIARRQIETASAVDFASDGEIGRPVVPDEVWAAGVTYQISEEAREAESGMPDMYLDVYGATRPEVFFKGTDRHVVGPGSDVGIRGDSEWDVPEPELGIVLYDGSIVGYTLGNDMSSRSIEGQNPLYLPQAKVYDRACAIGPAVISAESVDDPHDLEMSMTITRDEEIEYDESTNTGEMVRSCEELVETYRRHQAVPELSVLLTGTSLVPPEGFTLRPDDRIVIELEEIGTMENVVVAV